MDNFKPKDGGEEEVEGVGGILSFYHMVEEEGGNGGIAAAVIFTVVPWGEEVPEGREGDLAVVLVGRETERAIEVGKGLHEEQGRVFVITGGARGGEDRVEEACREMDISDPVVGAEGIRDVLGEISMGDFKGRKTVPHSEMKEKRRGRVKMAKRALAVGGVLGIVGAGIWCWRKDEAWWKGVWGRIGLDRGGGGVAAEGGKEAVKEAVKNMK